MKGMATSAGECVEPLRGAALCKALSIEQVSNFGARRCPPLPQDAACSIRNVDSATTTTVAAIVDKNLVIEIPVQ